MMSSIGLHYFTSKQEMCAFVTARQEIKITAFSSRHELCQIFSHSQVAYPSLRDLICANSILWAFYEPKERMPDWYSHCYHSMQPRYFDYYQKRSAKIPKLNVHISGLWVLFHPSAPYQVDKFRNCLMCRRGRLQTCSHSVSIPPTIRLKQPQSTLLTCPWSFLHALFQFFYGWQERITWHVFLFEVATKDDVLYKVERL